MKKSIRSFLLPAVALGALYPDHSVAQNFFRDYGLSQSGGSGLVTPSEYTYEDLSPSGLNPLRPGQDLTAVQQAEENDRYNFAIGPVHFGIAVGVGIEYNDNITLADKDRVGGFGIVPALDLGATWRMSELNTLRFSVGLGYVHYFDHPEYDSNGILITPSSELALTFYLGQVKLTIRDRFSYQDDIYALPTLSNVAHFSRYENQVGLEVDWGINQNLDLIFGYDHYNLWATDDLFQYDNVAIDTVFLKPAVQISPAVTLGVSGSYSFIDFEDSGRGDGTNLLVGPFIRWQVSEYTNLYLEGGYQDLRFDNNSVSDRTLNQLGLSFADSAAVNGILNENQDSSSFYIKFEINNQPAPNFEHRLSFTKTSEIGFTLDYYELYHVEYDANWECFRNTEIVPTVFYEYFDTPGAFGESGYRIGAALGIRYHFTNSLTAGLDYRYIMKDSNINGADYYQNVVLLSLFYKF